MNLRPGGDWNGCWAEGDGVSYEDCTVPAELIVCGPPAAGVGGDFERESARTLRDQLPNGYIIATNVYLARGGGGFYECDAVLAAPGICDVLEIKCIRPGVSVGEDLITTSTGFCVDRVLSTLNNKAKVLSSRMLKPPFPSSRVHRSIKVDGQVVVPSDTRINFKYPAYNSSRPVRTLADTVAKYRELASESNFFGDTVARHEIRNAWVAYRDTSARGQRRTYRHLGRFAIRRQLKSEPGVYEYFAVDEPPCQMEVHLREFPFDPELPARELDVYLHQVAREMRILMKVRHPYVSCVIGHFQTGSSWVQVSDWFEGDRLDDIWPVLKETSGEEKMDIFIKAVQALQFCHERGVFHRNFGASALNVSQDLSDTRLGGFDCALDLSGTSTTSTSLARRDPRLVAPEDLQTGRSSNPRLSDIFQAGVLLYRLLENGEWPFSDTLEYVTSGGQLRPFSELPRDRETERLRSLALRMMDVNTARRPDLLKKVEQELEDILSGTSS
jgi:serine/threonine protein kinase